MKRLNFLPLAILAFAPVLPVLSHAEEKSSSTQVTAVGGEMTDGEIRKVDKEAKKITIKHGEIKSLDMPPMTMVFQVKDVVMLDQVKTGDKVKFSAEKSGGAIVITKIEPVPVAK